MPQKPPTDDEPRLGNRAFDDAGRAAVQREADRWRNGVRRTYDNSEAVAAEVRAKLGPEARVLGDGGGLNAWERLAARAQLAQQLRPGTDADDYAEAYGDVDDLSHENDRFGVAIPVASGRPQGPTVGGAGLAFPRS